MLKAEFINPFVEGAIVFFKHEMGIEIARNKPSIESCHSTPEDVTVLTGVTGDTEGIVLYSMNSRTAKNIASELIGNPVPLYDQMAESALAEMGNIITGQAAARLESLGYTCKLSPPALITGEGALISAVSLNMLVIPLVLGNLGKLSIYVALQERSKREAPRQTVS
ncbi:MAG: chemotaxis protein CheX [Bacillota bacterium]|nr:chemotaxis protein CheX [Candidatus Fermentithermobacillaceae bacterium]